MQAYMTTGRVSGHQSFPFRNTWPTKGVNACANSPSFFREPDAMVTLGVGKNMVESIRYWCQALKLLETDPNVADNRGSHLIPTEIGRNLFLPDGWDPYLEDQGTLWLLHYLLATNWRDATTTYYAFNEIVGQEFTRGGLEHAIDQLAQSMGSFRATTGTIRRDVNVFIRGYVGSSHSTGTSIEDAIDSPLAELGLIREDKVEGRYAFMRGPKENLPDAVVLYAISQYADLKPERRTFTFSELAYEPLGPGRVFKLDEASLAERLEKLADLTRGSVRMTETAGYRQVLLDNQVEAVPYLERYYSERWGEN
jgi:hypothetical protein